MKRVLERFRRDESGAVTVDWVVLTAAALALGLGAATIIAGAANPQADNLGNFLSSHSVGL
jgi:Flp pilus assembly pilin Flp